MMIRDAVGQEHPEIHVSFDGEDPARYCGATWCTGGCGLPALVLGDGKARKKAAGSAVACGAVMQSEQVRWRGKVATVPEEHRGAMLKAWWL